MDTTTSTTPFRVVRTNASTGASYSNPICIDGDELKVEAKPDTVGQETESEASESVASESCYSEFLGCSPNNSVETESVSEEVHVNNDKTNNNSNSNRDDDDDVDDNDNNISEADDCHYKGQMISDIEEREAEPGMEAQEWTYEDHYPISTLQSTGKHRQNNQDRRSLRYERAERRRISKLMWFGVFLLLLEVCAATIAVMNHQELVECCGQSIFSETETVAERWNQIFYWIGIAYLIVIILIEIPTMVIALEPMFLFNPMVGYLLVMQMMYATDTRNAYIIYGLETVAMLGQSTILVRMQRSPEMCIHSILNYTLSGIVVYLLIELTQQGGYCIVNDRIQSVFSDSTCNIACNDEESCFRCTGDGDDTSPTQCFIQFS